MRARGRRDLAYLEDRSQKKKPVFRRVRCPGQDLNLHALRRYHLKVVRLPIPPPGRVVALRSAGELYADDAMCRDSQKAYVKCSAWPKCGHNSSATSVGACTRSGWASAPTAGRGT